MDLDQLVDVAQPGERVDMPDLIFLLRHSATGSPLLFDLGVRSDPHNLPAGTRALAAQMGIRLTGAPDLRAALALGGLAPADIAHVCISHIHLDHTGDPALFPNATVLLGGAAEAEVARLAPDFHGTVYAVEPPPGRTRWLATGAWPPLGPFPHALDFFGDGSVYIVDAAGHVPGHVNALVRTSADGGWLFLAGDSAHDWRVLRGEATFAHHPVVGCLHTEPEKSLAHVGRIRKLLENPRVRVLLAHDIPWYEQNKGGPAFWPGEIPSL